MISKKWMTVICIIILGLYVQPILAQDGSKNLTATVNTFTGESSSNIFLFQLGNKELKGNLIITENEGKDQNINISFTNLIEENSSQVLDKSKINVTSADLNKDQSEYIVTVKGYSVWVGEISINTTGIKSGTYNGKVIIERANFTPLDVGLSVRLSKYTLPKWIVLLIAAILIIATIAIILFFKDPKIGVVFALIPAVAGIFMLDSSSPFDATGTILLNTAFLVPLAAYIIDYLKTRRDDRLALEKSVTEVKKKAVNDAVDFHSALLEEISAHAATFSCINGVGANPLEDNIWNDGKKKAGMVSDLHGLILAKYYQHTDDFNNYLKARNDGQGSLENPNEFDDFCSKFDEFNKAYKELVDILYYNLFYNIGSFQYKFHSFKEFEVHFRIPDDLRHYLVDITGKRRYLFSWEEITRNKNFGDKRYLFTWDEIIRNDKGRLKGFLKKNFGIDWLKAAEIKSINNWTIEISNKNNKNNNVRLKLNDDKNKVNLEIDGDRTDVLIAKMVDEKLKIYEIIINKDKKIYNEKVATRLMKKIEKEFDKKYMNLQKTLQELSKFKIHKESVVETSNAKKPSITVTYNEDTTPPSISITSPTNNQIFTTANLTVRGTASGNVALSKVEVKVGSGSYQMATGTESWSKSVTLASGCNTIYARVTDTSGNVKETSITANYNKK
ncbi:MAG: Ig-like domain-containing protein [Candidatus Methanoperedens sp.]|nr:Ig-like domain-containing protein [Candidatus Methanoperedens sp.]